MGDSLTGAIQNPGRWPRPKAQPLQDRVAGGGEVVGWWLNAEAGNGTAVVPVFLQSLRFCRSNGLPGGRNRLPPVPGLG